MFGLFKKKDPATKLEKEYENLLARAKDVQRSGDLRTYAAMIEESEELWARIEKLRAGR